MSALRLRELSVAYRGEGGWQQAVRGVSLELAAAESYGLVGESGSGKSTLALAALGALPAGARVTGTVELLGRPLEGLSSARRRQLWRQSVRFVPQDAQAALNPAHTIGRQLREAIPGGSAAARRRAAAELLARVGLGDPDGVARAYPHQLSGGMQQRVMIAMALAAEPELLVMDEPTTGLDVTTEAGILELIRGLRRDLGTALLFVSHNLAVVAGLCDRVGVLRGGVMVEEAPALELFERPRHPYTRQLLRDVPRLEARRAARPAAAPDQREPILVASGVSKSHARGLAGALRLGRGARVRAVDGVGLEILPGRTLGLVGESGSGKSSLARAIAGLDSADEGSLALAGEPLPLRIERRSRAQLRALQMVFQNSDASLSPHRSVTATLRRSVRRLAGVGRAEAESVAAQLLAAVRLDAEHGRRLPEQLSGGERQRAAVARAFAAAPRLVIFDEAVSALDVTVQAAVLRLIGRLQRESGAGYLFISHDLAVVAALADEVAVMYLGALLQRGPTARLLEPPHHPYVEALLAAVPRIDAATPGRPAVRLRGEPHGGAGLPSGCRFHPRCPRYLGDICRQQEPPWQQGAGGTLFRCHIPAARLAAEQGQAAAPTEE